MASGHLSGGRPGDTVVVVPVVRLVVVVSFDPVPCIVVDEPLAFPPLAVEVVVLGLGVDGKAVEGSEPTTVEVGASMPMPTVVVVDDDGRLDLVAVVPLLPEQDATATARHADIAAIRRLAWIMRPVPARLPSPG